MSTSAGQQARQQKLSILQRFKNLGKPRKHRNLGNASTEAARIGSARSTSLAATPVIGGADNAGEQPGTNATEEMANIVPQNGELTEPTYLARKIRALTGSLPSPDTSRSIPVPKSPKPPARDPTGRPIPPPGVTPIKDRSFIAMLSSATIMNGSNGTGRPTVWSILESLGAPQDETPQKSDRSREDDTHVGDGVDPPVDEPPDPFPDDSSVMMYSPLLPTKADLVELADSELLQTHVEEEPQEEPRPQSVWMSMWPFAMPKKGKDNDAPQRNSKTPVSTREGSSDVGGSKANVSRKDKPMRIEVQRVWIPSTVKLSLQAMWWGYRIFLPPPVLHILNDKQLEATKRAAMITTALTWFFSNLPISSLPVAIRPALFLLQRIVPYLSYIGTFISWSWSTIKSYDEGLGVILTATWLLPIALIPSTWREDEFPTHPPLNPSQQPTDLGRTVSGPSGPSPPLSSRPAAPTTPNPPGVSTMNQATQVRNSNSVSTISPVMKEGLAKVKGT